MTGGPAFDLLLVAHVAVAVIGFGSIALTGGLAWRGRHGPDGPAAATLRRFFTGRTDVVGRTVYLVPVLGVVLLALSHGTYGPGDTFVLAGAALWVGGVAVAESVVWPGARRIGVALAAPPGTAWPGSVCRRVAAAALADTAVLVAASWVMFAKP